MVSAWVYFHPPKRRIGFFIYTHGVKCERMSNLANHKPNQVEYKMSVGRSLAVIQTYRCTFHYPYARESGAEIESLHPFKFRDGILVLSPRQLETLARQTGITDASLAEKAAAVKGGWSSLRQLSEVIVGSANGSLQPCAWNMLLRRRYGSCTVVYGVSWHFFLLSESQSCPVLRDSV